ncbi:MAG: quinone-dependent dihydroorotate dehydrogenase [Marinifilaceae bacterium]
MYKSIVRPLLFKIEPEEVHDMTLRWLKYYRHTLPIRNWIRKYCHTSSPYTFGEMQFKNRIGLSAGFDKNAVAFDELADFGFGFIELGTITPNMQKGNPSPRIFRIEEDDSLISRTGFNNHGLTPILERIKAHRKNNYILGININKDLESTGNKIGEDLTLLYKELAPYVDYFTLNWGSIEPDYFTLALEQLNDYRLQQETIRPIFIKLPADISFENVDNVISLARRQNISGFIATGPTTDKSALKNTAKTQLQVIGNGGVSGRGIGQKSLAIVSHIAHTTNGEFLIIGAGGIMSANEAMAMLHAGANLIQIYSAFIYSGPFIVRNIGKLIESEYKR